MSRAQAFEHITLTTGATRMSRRSEVGPGIPSKVARCIAAGGDLWAGWSVTVETILPDAPGRDAAGPGGWVFDALHSGRRVVRCWLCRLPELSDQLWEDASGQPLEGGVVLRRPRGVPWLAAWLDHENVVELIATPDVLMQAGDLERCVAWALLDGA
jgi:hypothetical protein